MLNILLIEDAFGISEEIIGIIEAAGYIIGEKLPYSEYDKILNCIFEKKINLVISNIKPEKEATIELLITRIASLNESVQFFLLARQRCIEYTDILIRNDISCCLCLPEEKTLINRTLKILEQRDINENLRKKKEKAELYRRFLNEQGELNSLELNKLFAENSGHDMYQTAVVRILPPYRRTAQHSGNNLTTMKGIELLYNHFEGNEKSLIIKKGIDHWLLLWGSADELENSRSRLKKFLSDIEEMNYSCFKVAAWVTLSSKVEKISEIYRGSQMLPELLKERIIKNSIEIFEYASWQKTYDAENEEGSFSDIKRTLLNAIEMFDEESIHRTLMQLRQNVTTNLRISGIRLFQLYKEIMAILFISLERQGVDTSETGLTYESVIKEYDYYWSTDNVFDNMHYYLCEGAGILKKHLETNEPSAISRAKQYIREFFSMSLTLKSMSDYLGMSEAYFSNYFKKYTNQTFKQYLTDVRIRYAKQMLLDGSIRLEDIAESVGYNDKKYFSRVFKRETGYTPGEYRMNKRH